MFKAGYRLVSQLKLAENILNKNILTRSNIRYLGTLKRLNQHPHKFKIIPLLTTVGTAGYFTYVVTDVFCKNEIDTDALDSGENIKSSLEKWTLYQYATCPFCCKVRTFLDFYGMDYDLVEVNPVFRNEIKFSEYRKVPILKSGSIQLNDSSLIISILKCHRLGLGDIDKLLPYYPILEDGKKKEYQNRYNLMYQEGLSKEQHQKIREEMKWRSWVDHTFVHTLSPNIYRTMKEALQAMEYITHVGNFSTFERQLVYYSGAAAMYVIGKRVKKRYALKDDVRESLYTEARLWCKAIGKDRKYLGGDQPNLADLNMYGVISAIEGLDAFEDLMSNTNIKPWYTRMKKQVQSHAGANQPDWLLG